MFPSNYQSKDRHGRNCLAGESLVAARLLRSIGIVLLVGFGFVAGKTLDSATSVHAQSSRQDSEPRQAFLSGGARSERVLEEISQKLSGIDERLERIENLMK